MILATGCLAEKALHGEAIATALEALGLDRVVLSAAEGRQASGLRGLKVAAVTCPWAHRRLGIAAARDGGANRLVLEVDPTWEPEQACPALFELGRSVPGLTLALATPREGPLASPGALELVLDDLAAQQLGYWHHPARAFLLERPDVTWLDPLARRLVGLSLDDVADGRGGLPPGLGALDLPRLAELIGPGLEVTLDVDPLPDVALLRMAVDELKGLGFP